MQTKLLLLALAAATLTAIVSAKAQDLTPDRTQLQWEYWDINIKSLVVSSAVQTYKEETAPDDSLFVSLRFTVKNNDHYGKTFISKNELKAVIGDNKFDAADLEDKGEEYTKNIEPTLVRQRACYFEIPKALFKDSFTIRFEASLSSPEDVHVSITEPKPTPTPTPGPVTSTIAPMPNEMEDKIKAERLAKEEEQRKLFEKQEAEREARGDFSQAPGLTSEQKEAAEIRWAEKDAAQSIKNAKPAPQ